MPILRTFHLFAAVTLIMASLAGGSPVVTMSTTPNIGGSGYEAIDFYYVSSPGADFTNYRLNLETTGGGYIYDPLSKELQNTGGNSIDTFMNTVGSYLGISDAAHIQSIYTPTAPGANSSPISRIDWSVFDTLSGDSNAIEGYAPGPYHMARVLVSPGAQWNASFEAYDTLSAGMATTWRFTNNSPLGTMDPIVQPTPAPEPPIVLSPPIVPETPPTVTTLPTTSTPPIDNPSNPPVAKVDPLPEGEPAKLPPDATIGIGGWTVIVDPSIGSGITNGLVYYLDPTDSPLAGVNPFIVLPFGEYKHLDGLQAAMATSINGLLSQTVSDGTGAIPVAYANGEWMPTFNVPGVDHDGLATSRLGLIQGTATNFFASLANQEAAPAPEPAALFLMMAAQGCLLLMARCRRR